MGQKEKLIEQLERLTKKKVVLKEEFETEMKLADGAKVQLITDLWYIEDKAPLATILSTKEFKENAWRYAREGDVFTYNKVDETFIGPKGQETSLNPEVYNIL
jgi:hypothetical protein